MRENIQKTNLKHIIVLQLIVIIYTFSTFFGKMASGNEVFSGLFMRYVLLQLLMLAVYALLWQQALKRFDLHVAYANRAFAIVWGMVWSALFLGESITVNNIIGTVIIVIGMVVVNSDVQHE